MNIPNPLKWFFKQDAVELISSTRRLDPLAAFEGQFPAVLTATKTDPAADDNIAQPLVTHIVETSVAHEIGDGIQIKVEGTAAPEGGDEDKETPNDEAAEQRIQTWLEMWLKQARFQSKVRKATQLGTLYGHRYLKLVVGADGKPSDLCVINPQTVTVTTDPRDVDRALSFTISWTATDPATSKDIQYQEITRRLDNETWEITEWQRRSGAQWEMIGEAIEWPYAQPPVYGCQNLTDPHAYTGRPDVSAAAVAQNQAINIQLSLLARMLRNHANPKTFVSGLILSRGADRGGVNFDTAGVAVLPDGAKVDQLQMQTGGAMAALELVKTLRQELHVTTRTPEVASGKLDSTGPLSGAALSILYKPLDEKTSEKRSNMAEMLEKLLSDILKYSDMGDWQVSITWPDTTPRSALEQRQVAQIDSQLGASKESILADLGYDPAVEKERVQDEQSATTDNILTALNRN